MVDNSGGQLFLKLTSSDLFYSKNGKYAHFPQVHTPTVVLLWTDCCGRRGVLI